VTGTGPDGAALAQLYWRHVVAPLVAARFPGMPCAAGRLGTGSDVLGLDDATSRDHDWGLRLTLLVPVAAVHPVDAVLEKELPERFGGLPTRFARSGEVRPRHQVDVGTVAGFLDARLGFDPCTAPEVRDWLSLSGQCVLEVVAGPLFADGPGEISAARRALEWYPDDVWRYVLACDWIRLAQELPLLGRATDVGDELGARVVAARLARVVMHLAFLLERRWPPYAKWYGSAFGRLGCAADVGRALTATLDARDRHGRQEGIATALEALLAIQNAHGLSDVDRATVPFWDRPYLQPHPHVVRDLLDAVSDPAVRALPRGRGSVDQRTDNVDVLVDPRARRAAIAV